MADKEIFGNSGPVNPKLKRATFDKSFINNLTAKVGKAIPVLVEECPPDSAYSIDTNFAFDFHPMWYPIQNNVTAHLSFWRVPFRILWKHYKRFNDQIGADGKINGSQEYTMPYIKRAFGVGSWCEQNSLSDYMGLPTNFYNYKDDLVQVHSKDVALYNFRQLVSAGVPINNAVDLYKIGATIPAPSSQSFSNLCTYGLNIIPKGIDFADGAYIDVPFYHLHEDNLVANLTSSLTSASVTCKALLCRPTTQGSDPFSSTAPAVSFAIDETFSLSYEIILQNTFQIAGRSVSLLALRLNIDPSNISNFRSFFANNGRHLLVQFDSSAATQHGIPIMNLLVNQDIAGVTSSVEPITDISSADKEPIVYTDLTPQVTTLGWTKFVYILSKIPLNGSHDRFCSVEGADPAIPINALPFRAYEFIRNYYFRNSRVNPFMKVDPDTGNLQECYDEYITNDGDGADETTPVDMFEVPWEYDMFTTAVPRPIYGNAPLVGLSVNKDGNGDFTSATFEMVDSVTSEPYTFNVKCNPKTGGIVAIDNVGNGENSANTPVFDALNYAISCGISISDFRNADALTRFSEKRMRAGNKHIDIVKEFFGVVPPLGEEYPTYLGGVSRRIMVNKILNVAQSEGNPLGDFAGSAVVNGKSKRIRTFCKERCYIIGLLWFSVTPLYSQQLPKHFIKSKLLDYYNPLFANISAQPIYCKELAPLQLSNEEIDDVFGYGRPWADYISRRDEVHGDFRGNMADFLFQRIFYQRPRLNSSFIDMNSADLTNVFSNTDDNDKIFGQVSFGIRAKLPIPRYSNPQII